MNRTVPPIGRDPGRFGRIQAACAWLRSKAGKITAGAGQAPALRFGSWALCVFRKTRKLPMNWTAAVSAALGASRPPAPG